jgi:hypothetical protein
MGVLLGASSYHQQQDEILRHMCSPYHWLEHDRVVPVSEVIIDLTAEDVTPKEAPALPPPEKP